MGTDISQESNLNQNDVDKKSDLDELHDELNRSQRKVTSIIESFIELGVSVYDSPPPPPGTSETTQGMITNLERNVDRLFNLNQGS